MDFSGADYSNLMSTPATATLESFPNTLPDSQQPYSPDGIDMGSFRQPFVPQDLWQMPMTFEWDWGDMGGGVNGFPAAFDPSQAQGQQQEQNGLNGHMQM